MRQTRRGDLVAAAIFGLFAVGCGTTGTAKKGWDDAAVQARADALLAQARALEPRVSVELKKLAPAVEGESYELRSRLKPRASLIRKLKEKLDQASDLGADEIQINDVLRYTILVKDVPAGHYMATVKRALSLLETIGYSVGEVRNYWPDGDYYSGLDCVLKHPDGQSWELQFHTDQSIISRESNDNDYKEFRDPKTPLERRRELFDRMASKWKMVPAPQGVLPGTGLKGETIVVLPRP